MASILDGFLSLLSFALSLLMAYLGDCLFRIPNGVTLSLPTLNKKHSRLLLRPWFNFQLPSFIGIILSGILVRNYLEPMILHLNFEAVNAIRILATITIIYRIGLGLDLNVLKKHKPCIIFLSLVPNILEAGYVTLYSWKLKGILTKDFAFCLGFEVSGASTAVLMPILLELHRQKVNHLHNVPAILLAASVLDNIFSIFAFNFSRTLALSPQTETFWGIFRERLEGLLIGVVIGILLGVSLRCLIKKTRPEITFAVSYLGGALLVFWLDGRGFRGAGFILVFISTLLSTNNEEKIEGISEKVWAFLRLYLFFFIGISIDFRQLDYAILEKAVFLVLSSSVLRSAATILLLWILEPLSRKEVVFGGITWMAKASLQAALGTSIFYESVARNYPAEIANQALIISQISICYILITGPLGAVFLSKYGRRFLEGSGGGTEGHFEEKVNLIVR